MYFTRYSISHSTKMLTTPLLLTCLFLSNIMSVNALERNSFVLELGQVAFDAKAAEAEGIEDVANFFRFAYGKQNESIVYGIGLSGFLYQDNESFKQEVVNLSGNQSTAKSNSDSLNAYVEGGYIFELAESFTADLLGGYEHVVQSSRSIANCSNCKSEDIKIKAGVYVSSRLGYEWSNGFKMSLFYRQYLSGDVENAAGLNSTWNF